MNNTLVHQYHGSWGCMSYAISLTRIVGILRTILCPRNRTQTIIEVMNKNYSDLAPEIELITNHDICMSTSEGLV